MKEFRFHILMGLPGSGKTYFVNNLWHQHQSNDCEHYRAKGIDKGMFDVYDFFIELDDLRLSGVSLKNVLYREFEDHNILYRKDYYPKDAKVANIVIDGLILTNEVLQTTIKSCLSYLDEHYKNHKYRIEFLIHKWNEDRGSCLSNDKYRVKFHDRDESAEVTIRNAKFEEIDLDWLDKMIMETENVYYYVYKHSVTAVDPYSIAFKPMCSRKEKVMTSDSWSGGGTSGNCWDDELHTIYPEDAPSFKKFDDFIEKICPNITFIQYKKLYNECVSIESYPECDYYGGCETRNYYECNMVKLYEMMQEMKLI